MKKLIALAATLVAALAIADILVEGAHGRGIARSEEGKAGQFALAVAKATPDEGDPKVEGSFAFTQVRMATSPEIKIGSVRIGRVAVEDNTCGFAGPAVMTVGDRTVRGRVEVFVADNKDADETSTTLDRIRVKFSVDGTVRYGFRGGVVRGDIVVGSRIIEE